jgi:hypothetical protein
MNSMKKTEGRDRPNRRGIYPSSGDRRDCLPRSVSSFKPAILPASFVHGQIVALHTTELDRHCVIVREP